MKLYAQKLIILLIVLTPIAFLSSTSFCSNAENEAPNCWTRCMRRKIVTAPNWPKVAGIAATGLAATVSPLIPITGAALAIGTIIGLDKQQQLASKRKIRQLNQRNRNN